MRVIFPPLYLGAQRRNPASPLSNGSSAIEIRSILEVESTERPFPLSEEQGEPGLESFKEIFLQAPQDLSDLAIRGRALNIRRPWIGTATRYSGPADGICTLPTLLSETLYNSTFNFTTRRSFIPAETSVKDGQPDWKKYWSDKTDPGSRPDSNIQNEVRELLYHLDGGTSILDFGCGTAEILIHYAACYARVVGADFSESMLAQARLLVQERQYDHVELLHADDRMIWSAIDESFDRITSCGVIQFMDPAQVEYFIAQAADRLNPGGKIALFDIVDPRLTVLAQVGLLNYSIRPPQICREIGKRSLAVIAAKIRNEPSNQIGYSYSRGMIIRMGRKANLDVVFAQSMYNPDRYHAILSF